MEEMGMTLEEIKQNAIDYYVNLMRIKADEKSENKELDRQIEIARIKLSTFSIDFSTLEKMFLKKSCKSPMQINNVKRR